MALRFRFFFILSLLLLCFLLSFLLPAVFGGLQQVPRTSIDSAGSSGLHRFLSLCRFLSPCGFLLLCRFLSPCGFPTALDCYQQLPPIFGCFPRFSSVFGWRLNAILYAQYKSKSSGKRCTSPSSVTWINGSKGISGCTNSSINGLAKDASNA